MKWKRLLALLLVIIAVNSLFYAYAADNKKTKVEGLRNKMEQLYLPNALDENMQKNMRNQVIECFNNSWFEWLKTTREIGKDYNKTDDELYQEQWEYINPKFENGFLVTCMLTENYMQQYVENNALGYLFGDICYWSTNNSGSNFTKEGVYFTRSDEGIGIETPTFVLYEDGRNYLKETSILESQLLERGETKVSDLKLFAMYNGCQLLYIKCEKNEYLVKLNSGNSNNRNMKAFELYNAKDAMNKIIRDSVEYRQRILISEKAIYSVEANLLQNEGVLQGNEKGLYLLKPLTRAESVAILIRALGLEEEASQYSTSMFSDISSDNWASPYAALAKVKGITSGVSETEFAPDNKVTSDQFATFVLRAAGETNVDYTQATQLLIDRGIITAEEAETMDLFTRGDMAKIIYEAREKGLLT